MQFCFSVHSIYLKLNAIVLTFSMIIEMAVGDDNTEQLNSSDENCEKKKLFFSQHISIT